MSYLVYMSNLPSYTRRVISLIRIRLLIWLKLLNRLKSLIGVGGAQNAIELHLKNIAQIFSGGRYPRIHIVLRILATSFSPKIFSKVPSQRVE